jgi:hypothetical protein
MRTGPTGRPGSPAAAGDDEEHVDIMVSGAPRIVPAYASFDYDELASENADRD